MRLSVGKILGVARHGLPKDRPLLYKLFALGKFTLFKGKTSRIISLAHSINAWFLIGLFSSLKAGT
jgi:hypothetical protein